MTYAREETLKFVLLVVLLFGLGFGLIIAGIGWRDWTLYSKGSPVPQQIRLADLAANGSPENVHVQVIDFVLGEQYVVEKTGAKWKAVKIPLFPVGTPQRLAPPGRVLLSTSSVVDAEQLKQLYKQDNLRGIIFTDHALKPSELRELARGYPGIDFSSAMVFYHNLEFPTMTGISVKLSIGGILVLAGLMSAVGLYLINRKARSKDFPFLEVPQ